MDRASRKYGNRKDIIGKYSRNIFDYNNEKKKIIWDPYLTPKQKDEQIKALADRFKV